VVRTSNYQTKPKSPDEKNNVNKADSNRLNSQNSTGPGDTTLTRFNAVKHGLSAKGMTELDDSEAYESIVQRLTLDYHPVGDLEIFWVRRIAFCMTRLYRAARLEASYIDAEMHPSSEEQDGVAPQILDVAVHSERERET
jgi:hypothetical protein